MSTVIDLRSFVDRSRVPMLVLVDLERDYLASPRVLAMPEVSEAIANCRLALAHARAGGFPVAFVRGTARAPLADPRAPVSRWIDGFEPIGIDMIFDRGLPSCYASPRFGEVIDHAGGSFVLAGLGGEAAGIATAVEAFHRGHRMTFLADACASHGLDDIGPREVHQVVAKVIDLYGDAIGTRTWIAATSRKSSVGRGGRTWRTTA